MISILLLSSCLIGGSRTDMLNKSNEEEKADERIEQILSVINDKDRDAMKALFSKKALGEIEDFDSQVDYLLSFFQGDLMSWEKESLATYETIDYGEKTIKIESKYTVETDEDIYLFYIIDYTMDTINPNNKGLYTLRVIKAADKEKEFTYWEDMEVGIYKPEE